MIRQQQAQLQALQSNLPANSASAIEDSGTPSDSSRAQTPAQTSVSRSNAMPRPTSISRHSSSQRASSSDISPSIRPHHHPHLPAPLPLAAPPTLNTNVASVEDPPSGSMSSVSSAQRDEGAFYQAETSMLTRENQMLKLRIRELERQISDMGGAAARESHSPIMHSALITAPVMEGEQTEL